MKPRNSCGQGSDGVGQLADRHYPISRNVDFCGTYDISRDPGNGRYAVHFSRLAYRNISNQ